MITVEAVNRAAAFLKGIARTTPLEFSKRLSEKYQADIYIKREDLQEVRSYKIRGAYHCMHALSEAEKRKGVVCSSAGNHAQGVAFSAALLNTKATVFMPLITPLQKIERVKQFGKHWVEVRLAGNTFDESYQAAQKFCQEMDRVFIHPFNDIKVMEGQGTVGKEIFEQLNKPMDYVICPIGGGGFIAGTGSYLKSRQANVHLIGAEPMKAASMKAAFRENQVVPLPEMDTFVDGAAVQEVGELSFKIASQIVEEIVLVEEGRICTTMIELYQNEGIISEPAGALSIAALEHLGDQIQGKTVVCVLSGGNNDIMRYPEILEKSLVYQGRKHYFLVEFAQKPGQLRKFLNEVLGPTDDIARFEYIKKNSKECGPALVGIELARKEDLATLLEKMEVSGMRYLSVTADDPLYSYLI